MFLKKLRVLNFAQLLSVGDVFEVAVVAVAVVVVVAAVVVAVVADVDVDVVVAVVADVVALLAGDVIGAVREVNDDRNSEEKGLELL